MKKERRHESKVSKEDSEKIARRERARIRKERKAREAADAPKGSPEGGTRKKVHRRSDQPPAEPASDLPIPEKTRKGALRVGVTTDNLIRMTDDPEEAKIIFCEDHHKKLVEKLKLHGLEHLISRSPAELKSKFQSKQIDPLYHSAEALIKLACNTIGTEGVVQHRCPVCALNKFDFISQIAFLMKKTCVRRPS